MSKDNAAYLASRAKRRKEAGLCLDCREPGQPALPGHLYCQLHTEKRNAKKKAGDDLRRAQGVCVDCGGKPEPGHVRCRWCRLKHNQATVEHTRRRREKGLCPRCGKHKPTKGRTYCSTCQKKYNRVNRKRYHIKKHARSRVAEFRQRFIAQPELVAYRFQLLMTGKPRHTGTAAD